MMNEEHLFDDFSSVSTKAWKQKIQVDLKGADYNDTLIWESPEGIKVKPFYNVEDLEESALESTTIPGSWNIGQRIYAEDTKQAREKCLEALENGVESLVIEVSSVKIDPMALFSELDMDGINIFVNVSALTPEEVSNWVKEVPVAKESLFVIYDIIGHLASKGNWFKNMESDFHTLNSMLEASEDLKLITVDASIYQNAGANRIQQLAYTIAHAKSYLENLRSVKPSHFTFSISVDTNYFFEIAKLRALRILWNKFTTQNEFSTTSHILAFPTRRNKTLYDYNVNMLRTTTESMAAILGGADTVFNMPYDHIYHEENEFAERIARNQLLILKNESYFDKVSNAATGSYYIEKLTEEMVRNAWALYELIENGGGFLNQLKQHKIQKKIKESAQKQQDAFENGREVLVGSNKYPNDTDEVKSLLQKDPFLPQVSEKTLIEPILGKRLSESLEKNRLGHE